MSTTVHDRSSSDHTRTQAAPQPMLVGEKSPTEMFLALLSMGESWHNSHHADPTCARHGVRRGQTDISARLIWIFEELGWATKVRWPRPERLARKLKTTGSSS